LFARTGTLSQKHACSGELDSAGIAEPVHMDKTRSSDGVGMQKKDKVERRHQVDLRKRIPDRTHGILRKMIHRRHAELCASDAETTHGASNNRE
jgi:hypothetical protein